MNGHPMAAPVSEGSTRTKFPLSDTGRQQKYSSEVPQHHDHDSRSARLAAALPCSVLGAP
jgi:hypothetical protein